MEEGDIHKVDNVTVHVHGSLQLPLRLHMVKGLEDPLMEEEILKEAIKVGVSERIGHFDSMKVSLQYSSGRDINKPNPNSTNSHGKAASKLEAKAELDLEALGGCVEAIQAAYDHIAQQAAVAQELLSELEQDTFYLRHFSASETEVVGEDEVNTETNEKDECLSKIKALQYILGEMNRLPTSVVDTAKASYAKPSHVDVVLESHCNNNSNGEYVSKDVTDKRIENEKELKKGLLDSHSEQDSEDEKDMEGGSDQLGEMEEEEEIDYRKMGYAPI